jgi:hypothetical protein
MKLVERLDNNNTCWAAAIDFGGGRKILFTNIRYGNKAIFSFMKKYTDLGYIYTGTDEAEIREQIAACK